MRTAYREARGHPVKSDQHVNNLSAPSEKKRVVEIIIVNADSEVWSK